MIRSQIAAINRAGLRSAHPTALSWKGTDHVGRLPRGAITRSKLPLVRPPPRHGLSSLPPRQAPDSKVGIPKLAYVLLVGALFASSLYPTDDLQISRLKSSLVPENRKTP